MFYLSDSDDEMNTQDVWSLLNAPTEIEQKKLIADIRGGDFEESFLSDHDSISELFKPDEQKNTNDKIMQSLTSDMPLCTHFEDQTKKYTN